MCDQLQKFYDLKLKKFILIDPSICGYGGHYFEYAIHVLRSAKQRGFCPVLVVNKRFQKSGDEDFEVVPLFKYDFWGSVPQPVSKKHNYVLHIYSYSIVLLQFLLKFTSNKQKIIDIFYVIFGSRAVAIFLNVVASPANSMKIIVEIIKERLIRPYNKDHACQVSEYFCEDMTRFFSEIDIDSDEIFIPTISENDLKGLGCFFSRNEKKATSCRWHLLFRRDLYSNRIASSSILNRKTVEVTNALTEFRRFAKSYNVFFYTDTDELTLQYKNLHVFDFKTLAIPVNPLYEKCQLPVRGEKCTVTYLGDARVEKGFQCLPRVIMELWSNYVLSGRLNFRLQVNFNSSCQHPSVFMARSQLLGFPREQVELIDSALSSDEYAEFVVSSDVILILYDSDCYSARSSGVFVEAMMAGKPVVVPAGTWMSKQLTPYIVAYHKSLLNGAERLLSEEIPAFSFGGCKAVFSAKFSSPGIRASLLLFMNIPDYTDGLFVSIAVDFYDENGRHIHQSKDISNPAGELGELSFLVPVDSSAQSIVVSFKNAYDDFTIKAVNVRHIILPADTHPPRSAVGGVYSNPNQISCALREVIDNLEHYRLTAAAFSSDWRSKQGVDRLVEGLLHG